MKSESATFLHIFPPEYFGDSIKLGAFLEKLKLAKVTPIFKSRKNKHLTNYRPISVLPCFSKILERIITENNDYKNQKQERLSIAKINLLFD